jgi:hypothetical protein
MNVDREAQGTVLLVEADAEERERFGMWLEQEGFHVMTCTGPIEPDYTCVGARAGACPLAEAASVVILDMSTRSEGAMEGTASEELLGLYLFAGAKVVTLSSHPGDEIDGSLVRLRRHPGRNVLVDVVYSLTDEKPHRGALW